MALLREINVWERVGKNTLVRHKCFEVVGESKYCVQRADWFRLPLDKDSIRYFEKEYIELLIDSDPTKAHGLFNTLREAIVDLNEDFEDCYSHQAN